MREFKFRYKDAEGKPFFKTVSLPDDASRLIGIDIHGQEVYEGDTVIRIAPNPDWGEDDFDEEKTFPMNVTFDDYGAILDGEIVKVTT